MCVCVCVCVFKLKKFGAFNKVWVRIILSCVYVCSDVFNSLQPHQTPLSLEFSWWEYWSHFLLWGIFSPRDWTQISSISCTARGFFTTSPPGVHGVTRSRTRLSDFTFTFHFHALEKEMATTPVFLPGESQGRGSLVGCRLWGRTESDTTEVTWQQQQCVKEPYSVLGTGSPQ